MSDVIVLNKVPRALKDYELNWVYGRRCIDCIWGCTPSFPLPSGRGSSDKLGPLAIVEVDESVEGA